ncbi:MAG: glycyl-radical enzyme activating protein [Candidatus Symbiothrix sp.]|jgi:pyruvate formate lyase activating enzyme|nr:glycyl-radical enzyme activating protein [Candidatus Symbiothrix sp.]
MDNIKIFGKGWNFSQDGPGNRLLYHFQGCNFTCPWCSNPEGIPVKGALLVRSEKLQDSFCPYGAIKNRVLDRERCETCPERACVHKNRNEAIRFSIKEYTIAEIIDEVENSRGLFHSGGGVTITGGEPTLQFKLLKKLLTELKHIHIHTAIETNASHERLPELFGLIDLLIMDIKHFDPKIHKNILGISNGRIIDNLVKAAQTDIDIWIRIPLIPDFNNNIQTMERLAEIIKSINRKGITVELLPYHDYGRVKWEQTGKVYPMPDKKIPADDLIAYRKIFINNSIQILKT